jgi:hypothetical protein
MISKETRFVNFLSELESLCEQHGVVISTSGYDGLSVWEASDFLYEMLTDPTHLHFPSVDNHLKGE